MKFMIEQHPLFAINVEDAMETFPCASFPDVVKWNYNRKGGVMYGMETVAYRGGQF